MKNIITTLAFILFLIPSVSFASALTNSQINAIISLLSSFGADASTVANVQASLTGGTPTPTSLVTTTFAPYTFSKDLTVGASGADVTALQNALIVKGYLSGSTTGYFGALTKAAVIKWQIAKGISPASGYFGAKSRAALGDSTTNDTANTKSGSTDTTSGTTAMTQAQLDAQNAAMGRSQFNTAPVVTTPSTTAGLKVSLSPTSPNGTVITAGQGVADLADFIFTNSSSAPINVTSLSFKRIGVSNDSTMTNVYLFNNAGTYTNQRITDAAGVSNSAFSYTNTNGIFTVPAGGTYALSVRADIASGTSGQQLGVSLTSVTSNVSLDPSVNLPISSGYQTVSVPITAGVNFSVLPTPRAGAALLINPQNDATVWQDTITVSTSPVKLTLIKFTNLGSIGSSNLQNLRLFVDDTQVGTVAQLSNDRTATFDLSANPTVLSTQDHTVKVLTNVTGGAAMTIQFSVQRSSDVTIIDSQRNQPVIPQFLGNSFSAVTAGVITINSVTPGSISVSLDPSSPTQNVTYGASNVKWATFDVSYSGGEDVKFFPCLVHFSTISSPGSVADTTSLQNLAIFANGNQICGNFPQFVLHPNQTVTVDIYADAKNGTYALLQDKSTVTVMLDAGLWNGQGQSSLMSVNVPTTAISGNAITVVASSTMP